MYCLTNLKSLRLAAGSSAIDSLDRLTLFLTALTSLTFLHAVILDTSLFRRLPHLEHLNLSGLCQADAPGLPAQLTHLDLGHPVVQDEESGALATVTSLTHMSRLVSLNLRGALVGDLRPLIALTTLTFLAVDQYAPPAEPLAPLALLPALAALEVWQLQEASQLEPLTALTGLTQLRVHSSSYGMVGTKDLKQYYCRLFRLASLHITDPRAMSAFQVDLAPLTTLSHLTHLHLQLHSVLHASGAAWAAALPRLASLTLTGYGTPLRSLSALTALTHLDVTSTSSAPVLRHLHGGPVQPPPPSWSQPPSSIRALRLLTRLKSLALNTGVPDNHVPPPLGWSTVTDISPLSRLSHLTALELCTFTGVRSLAPLAALKKLYSLTLDHPPGMACGEVLQPLLPLKHHLVNLRLMNVGAGMDGSLLSQLKQLELLELGYNYQGGGKRMLLHADLVTQELTRLTEIQCGCVTFPERVDMLALGRQMPRMCKLGLY